jgi:hypothetical protein
VAAEGPDHACCWHVFIFFRTSWSTICIWSEGGTAPTCRAHRRLFRLATTTSRAYVHTSVLFDLLPFVRERPAQTNPRAAQRPLPSDLGQLSAPGPLKAHPPPQAAAPRGAALGDPGDPSGRRSTPSGHPQRPPRGAGGPGWHAGAARGRTALACARRPPRFSPAEGPPRLG